jgi:hypothetical protein
MAKSMLVRQPDGDGSVAFGDVENDCTLRLGAKAHGPCIVVRPSAKSPILRESASCQFACDCSMRYVILIHHGLSFSAPHLTAAATTGKQDSHQSFCAAATTATVQLGATLAEDIVF